MPRERWGEHPLAPSNAGRCPPLRLVPNPHLPAEVAPGRGETGPQSSSPSPAPSQHQPGAPSLRERPNIEPSTVPNWSAPGLHSKGNLSWRFPSGLPRFQADFWVCTGSTMFTGEGRGECKEKGNQADEKRAGKREREPQIRARREERLGEAESEKGGGCSRDETGRRGRRRERNRVGL